MKPKLKIDKITKVIKSDATLRNANYNEKGEFCVIGGLLHACGFPMKKLDGLASQAVEDLPDSAKKLLEREYGLDQTTAEILQDVNDDYEQTEARREALINKLSELL